MAIPQEVENKQSMTGVNNPVPGMQNVGGQQSVGAGSVAGMPKQIPVPSSTSVNWEQFGISNPQNTQKATAPAPAQPTPPAQTTSTPTQPTQVSQPAAVNPQQPQMRIQQPVPQAQQVSQGSVAPVADTINTIAQADQQKKSFAEQIKGRLEDIVRSGREVTQSDVYRVAGELGKSMGVPQENLGQLVQGFSNANIDLVNKSLKQTLGYINTPNDELATAINAGVISESDISNIRMTDPVKYNSVQIEKNKQKQAQMANNTISGEYKPTQNISEPNKEYIKKDLGAEQVPTYERLYDEYVNTDEIKGLKDEVLAVGQKIANLQQDKINLSDDIIAEFGTSISKSQLQAITFDREKGINRELMSLEAEYNRVNGSYEARVKQGEQKLSFIMQEQKETWDRTMSVLNANNGQALLGLSGQELQAMEERGEIPQGFAGTYRNYAEGMVINTLSQYGQLTNQDLASIELGLKSGQTPQSILSNMMATGRFNPADPLTGKTEKIGDSLYQYNPNTKKRDVVAGASLASSYNISQGTSVYNDVFGQQVRFGVDNGKATDGADYAAPNGTPIIAPRDGTIYSITQDDPNGKRGDNIRVVLEFVDDDGSKKYMSVDHVDPKTMQDFTVGQSIKGGQPFGYIGNTGNVMTAEGEWIKKGGKVLRPDLLHRGNHASVNIYSGAYRQNPMTISQVDSFLKSKTPKQGDQSLAMMNNFVAGRLAGDRLATHEKTIASLANDPEQLETYLKGTFADNVLQGDQKKIYNEYETELANINGALDTLQYYNTLGVKYNPNRLTNTAIATKSRLGIELSQEEQDQQTIMATIQGAQAQKVNQLFGATLTQSEQAKANFFTISAGDDISSALAKMQGQKMIAELAQRRLIDRKLGLKDKDMTATIDSITNQFKNIRSGTAGGSQNVSVPVVQTQKPSLVEGYMGFLQ